MFLAIAGGILLSIMFAMDGIVIRTVLINAFSGMFVAIIFHEPLISWLQINDEIYRYAVVALLATTGADLIRTLLSFIRNPGNYIEFFSIFKGKGK
jgi:hypothetical protein